MIKKFKGEAGDLEFIQEAMKAMIAVSNQWFENLSSSFFRKHIPKVPYMRTLKGDD